MLEASRLPDLEITRLLDQGLDADYWRRFCPALGVEAGRRADMSESRALSPSELQRIAETFQTDGYFHAETILPAPQLEHMRDCVARLRAAHWPPVFAFVFDQFWTAVKTAPVEHLLSKTIGAGCRQNSVVWTYYVVPRDGASGWRPHTDGNGSHRLTMDSADGRDR